MSINDTRQRALDLADDGSSPGAAVAHALVYVGDCIRDHHTGDEAFRAIATELGGIGVALSERG